MPLEVLLPACTPDGSTSTSSWAQGRQLSDLSVQGDARGMQQSTLRTEEVNQQRTYFSVCIAALGVINPARPFLVVRCGVRFVGCMLATRFILRFFACTWPHLARQTRHLLRVVLGLEAAQRPPGTSAPHGSRTSSDAFAGAAVR